MDIKREGVAKKKRIRMAIYLVLTAAGLGLVTWRLMLLKPAAPTVERATVWIDTVKRGPMVIDRRGLGALEPEDIIWIPAAFDGQVEKIVAHSGDDVKAGSVMLVLSNPDMQLAANDFEWQVKQAEATPGRSESPIDEQGVRPAVGGGKRAERFAAGRASERERRAVGQDATGERPEREAGGGEVGAVGQ